MIHLRYVIFIFVGVVSFLFSSFHVQAEDLIITVAGSSTVRPIITATSKQFKKKNPVVFNITGGGSSYGIKSVAMGTVTIGIASRKLNKKEEKKWQTLRVTTIGYDGIAIIVNKATQVTALTNEQIRDIYLGKISNWQEVGGQGGPIVCISRESDRGESQLFLEYTQLEAQEDITSMVYRKKGDQQYSSTKSRIIGSNKDAILSVSMRKNTIAYVSMGQALDFERKTKRILLPTVDGIEPVTKNVKNKTFPIYRPLNILTNGEPDRLVKSFIDYLLSSEGQSYVFSKNFIPVK